MADALSRGDIGGKLLCNATDVSSETNVVFMELVPQLEKLGKSGCAPFPCVKKK